MSTTPEATQRNEVTTTTTWMRLARGVAITMAIWAILLHLEARIIIPPVIGVGTVFLIFVPFLKGERRKLGLGFAAVSVVLFSGNLPVIISNFSHPRSAPSFALTLLSTAAVVVAVVAGLGAFFGWSTSSMRPLVVGSAAVVVLGSVGGFVAMVTAPSVEAESGDVEVVMERVTFDPGDLSVGAGAVGVWLDNRDGAVHTFTVEELGVDLTIEAKTSARVEFEAVPGTYEIICAIPGHETMKGTLTVTS